MLPNQEKNTNLTTSPLGSGRGRHCAERLREERQAAPGEGGREGGGPAGEGQEAPLQEAEDEQGQEPGAPGGLHLLVPALRLLPVGRLGRGDVRVSRGELPAAGGRRGKQTQLCCRDVWLSQSTLGCLCCCSPTVIDQLISRSHTTRPSVMFMQLGYCHVPFSP